MTTYHRKYTHERVMGGLVITRLNDLASCFLQGEDAAEVLLQLMNIDELWAEYGELPFGGYSSQAQHEDVLLEAHDLVMEVHHGNKPHSSRQENKQA